MRALLLLLVAAGASAQTPAAVYGTWEATRDTTFEVAQGDGTRVEYHILYSALEVSEAALTDLSVSVQGGEPAPTATAERYPYRADGGDLVLGAGIRVRLRLVGERLAARWSQNGTTFPEVLMDRAAPPDVPDALRGDWATVVTDAAGVSLELPVRLDARRLTIGNGEPVAVRYADGLLLWTDHVADAAAGEVQTLRVYEVRPDGAALVLATGRETLRLVRR